MAKKVESSFKLQIPAGKANPSPPVGPALGQRGVNIMEFCKAFNAQTQSLEVGQPCPVVVTVFSDKSFVMDVKTPPATFLILKALNQKSGASNTGTQVIGSISMDQVREIAEIKMKDLNAFDMDQACKIIAGSARSMGVTVAED